MIPQDYVTAWRKQVPWVQDFQVEQDLILSRALVEIFSHPVLAGGLAMRGGTAIYKLYLQPPARYSEDIDLVQTAAVPAGSMMDALREVLNPWLGTPKWKQTESRVTFVYRFDAEQMPRLPLRSKIEINTGAFPISRSRAHTHRRHGHPLQTVPSAGLIERPQEKNRVDALR